MHAASRLSFPPRQQGNTLIGIIIGLVIGLVIAVMVALAITKGSLPFTDKQGKTRAAEPNGGQILDPNKPMYGKDAAREPAREVAAEAKPEAKPEVTPPPPDALQQVISTFKQDPVRESRSEEAPKPAPARTAPPKPAAAPAPTAAAPAKPAAAPAPAPAPTAATPAKPAAAPAPAPAVAKADAAGDEKWVYYLQAGAFRESADAEGTRAKLALLGFEAAVTDRTTDTGVLHRVRMGPFQADAMNRARAKLAENGVDVAVIRNQKQ